MQLLPSATGLRGTEACAQELLEALPPVMRFLRRHMRDGRKHRNLSVPQFRILTLLGSAPAANLSAVADNLDASLPTASRIVSGLVGRGLIIRHECTKDRRQIELSLTPKGASTLESARAGSREKLAQELATLDGAELRTLSRALGLLHDLFAPKLRSVEGNGECRAAGPRGTRAEVK